MGGMSALATPPPQPQQQTVVDPTPVRGLPVGPQLSPEQQAAKDKAAGVAAAETDEERRRRLQAEQDRQSTILGPISFTDLGGSAGDGAGGDGGM
jgi:hypothetical protein